MATEDPILTRDDLESLLQSVGGISTAPASAQRSGGGPFRSIKQYDFRRPDKFSRENLRAIQNVTAAFARLASSSLTSFLRSSTVIQLDSVEQVVYEEYVSQLANPTIVNLVEMGGVLPGRIILELSLPMGMTLLDRMMGGTGQVEPKQSELTDIEIAVLRRLSTLIVDSLREPWSSVVDVQPMLVETVFAAEYVQAALPADVGSLLKLSVQALGRRGSMSICIPHPVVEPIMDRLTTQVWAGSARRLTQEDDRARVLDRLNEVLLPVVVELGSTEISLAELVELGVGDVIRLDQSADADLKLLVGGLPRLTARPGLASGNRAVQVSGTCSTALEDSGESVEVAA